MGLTFKNVLYKVEDWCDAIWKGRPEWARPAVLGLVFGLLLLALPQMYGVGYPVMFKATAGGYALWFLVVLAFGKILATSLTMGVGGSGGIFAPSLFIGVTTGYAYGDIVDHLFGAGAGQPALYAVIAMGAVFASAARAPLTSLASVVEMTGDFSLTLPVMLAVAIATAVSRALSYGTIYTTKLLRRGTDIDRPRPDGTAHQPGRSAGLAAGRRRRGLPRRRRGYAAAPANPGTAAPALARVRHPIAHESSGMPPDRRATRAARRR